jgi:hypothetical protein
MMEKYQRPPYNRTLREAGREEDYEITVEDWLPKQRGRNELRFLAADDRRGKNL